MDISPVFGESVDDIHNTKHGNYPGHTRAGENPEPVPGSHPNGATKLAVGAENMVTALVTEADIPANTAKNQRNKIMANK